jgi:hypothetical protein
MQTENDTSKPEDLPEQVTGEGCPGATCSALEFLAQELDMPAEHIREAARAMREEKLFNAAQDLHAAFFVMMRDWKDGDFDLPTLAVIHMHAMEDKAIELGKLLFRQNSLF